MDQILVTILIAAFACSALANDFHVAPTGNDANPGTAEKPFATLQRARDAVCSSMRNGAPMEGVTVWIAAGSYPQNTMFQLNASDSGTPEAPVVYRDKEGADVRISGGFRRFQATAQLQAHPVREDRPIRR
jgi:hypothetical protein